MIKHNHFGFIRSWLRFPQKTEEELNMKKRTFAFMGLALALIVFFMGIDLSQAASAQDKNKTASSQKPAYRFTPEQRRAAAVRFKKQFTAYFTQANKLAPPAMDPGGVPHYWGPIGNYANSPMPRGAIDAVTLNFGGSGYLAPKVNIVDLLGTGHGATANAIVVGGVITLIQLTSPGTNYTAPMVLITDAAGVDADATAAIGGVLSGGIRKFMDRLPGLDVGNANLLGQYIPVAIPDKSTYSDADYYEIELGQYSEKVHTDLPPTTFRGYRQTNTSNTDVSQFHYLGPLIVATKDRPVRIKFTNSLPTGPGGDLFIPVDTTLMGAGMGPVMGEMYTQNRAEIHLHGGATPWISDGTPYQWITPAGESTSYPKGVSVVDVPDMPAPGDGSATYYYTNQQSSRLMFYHDHAVGITRLNVYAGEAAGYLLTDPVEQDLIKGTNDTGVNPGLAHILPDAGIPLIIQDKTFVDPSTIASQDPTWNWGTTPPAPHAGDLWLPHVYMPNQNAYDIAGASAFGRWQYGPWFWPPTTDITYGPIDNPYAGSTPWETAKIPATPNPSMAMEAYMDTPMVNGTAYPYIEVEPRAYRFRILNAANDRFVNLQLYTADPEVVTADGRLNTEVKMVPAVTTPGFPKLWPTDGREGGVPDPATRGPNWIQIGTEGGFLPAPAVIPNQPVTWDMNQMDFAFGDVKDHSLMLGPAERADVIVDFSAFAGQTLIMYNDAPAAFPAIDPRYDYHTNGPDLSNQGGAPPTQPGYGPCTRTIMQIRVLDETPTAYDLNALKQAFAKTASKRGVFEVSQPPIIIPSAMYNSAYNDTFPADTYVRIQDVDKTFTTLAGTTLTIPFEQKAIHDEMGAAFDIDYGRQSGLFGLELSVTPGNLQNLVLYPYISPPVEIIKDSMIPLSPVANDGTQIWKITHNGVDSHPIHVHLFNVQLINRVGWDNIMYPPDANEIGWKETVRVDPLKDTIVALRPVAPTLPFSIPNSIRLIDPSQAPGVTLRGGPLGFSDPQGNAITVTNHAVNFGWEYVWHCHVLGHEEMDLMHAMAFAVAPEAPANLVAVSVPSPLSITLTWTDNSLDETGFTIQRATNNHFTAGLTSFTVPANVNTYSDLTIVDGVGYFYRVYANNVVGDVDTPGFPTKQVDSAFSNTAQPGSPTVPNPPTGLSATAVSGFEVKLDWTLPVGGISPTSLRIERSSNGGATWPVNFVIASPATVSYNDITVQPLTAYAYRIFAVSAGGDSLPSNTANVTTPVAPPPAPSNLVAVLRNGGTQVRLTWKDNSLAENGFIIERKINGGTYAKIGQVGANIITYTDLKSASNTTYFYRVRAFRTATGFSLPSNEASATTPILTPAAPSNLRVTATNRTSIKVAWNDNSTNETGFYVERSTDGVNFTRVMTRVANSLNALVQSLLPNTLYYFRVQSYNSYGTSAYSNVVSRITLP
jgi:FtsP/CotA-like multicopper oxidase with cupredoxin domain